jgi:protein gp37
MGDKTGIEWTDATWNPIVGCSIVSPGCTNCYAMKQADRIRHLTDDKSHYFGTTKVVNSKPVWTGKVALAPDHILTAPLRWKKPRKIFVNSMGDVFHEDVPDEWIDKVFAVMALAPQHTFQVLTKRSRRMRQWSSLNATGGHIFHVATEIDPLRIGARSGAWPLPNVWLGVSAEDQKRADERIPDLLATPAAVRFVSAEPLLGSINFTLRGHRIDGWDEDWKYDTLRGKEWANPHDDCLPKSQRLDWIIVGGESGPDARPMHPAWARDIRDQCAAAGVPFLFKQFGEFSPVLFRGKESVVVLPRGEVLRGKNVLDHPNEANGEIMWRVGKKAAGRVLDGVEHNGYPEARA